MVGARDEAKRMLNTLLRTDAQNSQRVTAPRRHVKLQFTAYDVSMIDDRDHEYLQLRETKDVGAQVTDMVADLQPPRTYKPHYHTYGPGYHRPPEEFEF